MLKWLLWLKRSKIGIFYSHIGELTKPGKVKIFLQAKVLLSYYTVVCTLLFGIENHLIPCRFITLLTVSKMFTCLKIKTLYFEDIEFLIYKFGLGCVIITSVIKCKYSVFSSIRPYILLNLKCKERTFHS